MQPTHTTPKDFFLYLFGAVSLYLSATMLITLLWQLINTWLPETGSYASSPVEAIRMAIAFLVISFPAYLIAMWWIGKDVDKEPGKREMWVRRWFIYATLFIAAIVMLGDLISILYAFLGGEIAMRFFLKALVVGAVAGAVFWYHQYILKRTPGTDLAFRKGITVAAAVVVGAAVVAGVAFAGSPSEARAQRDDMTRVSDLQSMQWGVTNFWSLKQRLPANAAEIVDPANPSPLPRDPKTGEEYRYEAKGANEFVLCANFETEYTSADAAKEFGYSSEMGITAGGKTATWEHGTGETCFTRTIDPERYPKPVPLQ